MGNVECKQCGHQITEDTETCPECGAAVPDGQREQLKQQAGKEARHRVYVYGRHERRLSPEVRAVIIILIMAGTLLIVCRLAHGSPNLGRIAAGRATVMFGYEYRVLRMLSDANVDLLNDRIDAMMAAGWEPVMMSGNDIINVMMRRPIGDREPAQATAAAALAAPIQLSRATKGQIRI